MTPVLDSLSHHRAPYRDAGAAMRQALERATVARVGPLTRSVLDAVLVLTVSYSKLTDTTTYREIARLAYGRAELHGRERERVREALHKLAELGIVEITPVSAGRYSRVVVTVPMATPRVADAMDTDSVADDFDDDDSMATSGGVNGHVPETPMATPGVAHLEVPRRISEEEIALEEEVIDLESVDHSSADAWYAGLPERFKPPPRKSCDICRGCKNPCTECARKMARAS